MILRSRASSDLVHTVENPAVRESIAAWERRMAAAEQDGRTSALAEAEARVTAAEARATAAEARAAAAEAAIRSEYEQRLGQAITALTDATSHLDALHHQLVTEAEGDIARLALHVAARLLRREVEDDPTWMEPVLAEALARVPDKRGIAVRLHPADAEVARERKRLIAEGVPGIERLEFFADDGLSRGACVIASQGTRLDAGLPGTWERLSGELLADPRPPLAITEAGNQPETLAPGEQP